MEFRLSKSWVHTAANWVYVPKSWTITFFFCYTDPGHSDVPYEPLQKELGTARSKERDAEREISKAHQEGQRGRGKIELSSLKKAGGTLIKRHTSCKASGGS
eukprot:1149299-Pelagomonas_calceolata.AAC.1